MTESETPANDAVTPSETSAPAAEPPPETAPAIPPVELGPQPVPQETPAAPTPPKSGTFWGTGRRKSSVARVRLTPGEGKILINKREVNEYFSAPAERLAVREPLIATSTESSFDIFVNVRGGGHSGQAGAIRLGLARALLQANTGYEPTFREKAYLTRDARVVERKKYGQRKARRRFQISKR